jgi:hypothetical protein
MFTHSVECPHCGKSVTHDWSEYIISSDVVDEDRGMGTETEHSIECDEFECSECHKLFSVSGSVWEYPESAYNYHELNTSPIE